MIPVAFEKIIYPGETRGRASLRRNVILAYRAIKPGR